MDGNEGSYSAPSTPIPSGRGAGGNEEGRSASPIPPPIYTMNNNSNNSTTNRGTNSTLSSSISATTINTNVTTTTSTTTSSQKFAQIQHPEKATSSFSINYFHRLKQFMVITLSPLDGTLHLYCFDLIPYSSETSNGFMNIQCNLHLLLNDKKTIKPTKSILHSFQIMDDYSNLYQFTFCDSNITPNGNNLSILSNNCNEISKMKMISCFFTMYIMIEYLFNYRWYQYQKQKEEQTKEQNQQTSSSSEKKSSSSSVLLPLYAKPRMIFIIKEGFLQKRGRINTSFKWRYFVLTNDYKLRYYKDDTNYLNYSNYKGVIDIMLIDYDVLNPYNSIQSFDQKEIIINMQKQKSRRWALRSDIPEDIKSWTSALNAALFQYQDYLQQKNNPTTTTSSNSNNNNSNSNSSGSGKYSSGQSLSPAPPPSISPYVDPNARGGGGGGGRNTGGSGSFGGGGPIQPVNFYDEEEDENEDEDD
jgi:hypothetical protein